MAFSVVMPALEMAQETGKLLAWRKKEGEPVLKGEPLLEIETDKAVVEVEAPADGILAGIKAAEGAEIPVGQTIAWIVAPGEQPPADAPVQAPQARASSALKIESSPVVPSAATESSDSRTKISPRARRLAKELGVDLASVRGSGPGGEILATDIQSVSDARATIGTALSNDHLEVPSTLGRLMAERTSQSWTTVPHFFVTRRIDATMLNAYRDSIVDDIERTHSVRVTHTDLLIAIVARVLKEHPRLNASWTSQGIRLHNHVNMGVAIAVNDGVVAAVVANAHTANIVEIAIRRRDIADRARAGKLHPSDISDATFTLSNLGMYKVDAFSAIITPPQAAILAVGAIVDSVVPIDGSPAVRPMMSLTVSCDHRVADGARAAQFMAGLADALQYPSKIIAA